MAYEIDFIGIENIIGVYDGGLQACGEKLQENLHKYYFDDEQDDKIIDFVICSHSDLDHISSSFE